MSDRVDFACEKEILVLPLVRILPTRVLDERTRKTVKFRCIEASIRELGLIEPLVVFPQKKGDGCFILLDGHVRYRILKDLEIPSAKCLVAKEDEGYTYNHKVSRLTAIQEHFMILKATKSGLSEARIAQSLNVNVASIRQKRDLLEGICPEAIQLLRDKRSPANAFRELRKVRPMRQIEIAELMCAAHNFSHGYVRCLIAASATDQLVDGERAKAKEGFSPDDIARMEREMATLGSEFKLIEESHGKNVLNSVLVVGYLKKMLDNARVVRYLSQAYPEILGEFQKLVEARGWNEGGGEGKAAGAAT